jgi:alkylation response protein AidB-like acyl-CoA dehydrogenase
VSSPRRLGFARGDGPGASHNGGASRVPLATREITMVDRSSRLIDERIDRLLAEADPRKTPMEEFRGLQFDYGLAWVHFPNGRGGVGLAPSLQSGIDERLRQAGAHPPTIRHFFGLGLAGPTVVTNGSDSLMERLLRRMFTGEDAWCQLFSEPGAGSDLASAACRAIRDGDEWVVTGQKVWTTLAHVADRGMLIVRTDPDVRKHEGLTYFALNMHAPGVEVRPLVQMTGDTEFNEVFLTDVRVPDADRIGEVGGGWRVAMTTLMNERTTIGGVGGPERGSGAIAEALHIWREEVTDRNPVNRERLMRLWCEAEVLRLTNLRADRTTGNPGPEGSIAKLMFAEVNQRIFEYCVDLLGARGMIEYSYEMDRAEALGLTGPAGSARNMFLRSRANSIEGGTSEIQRNILGERVLGLPSDIRLDKDHSWAQVPR